MTDHIDPQTQQYYENYFALFATPGWKQFIHDLTEGRDTDLRSAPARCDTPEKWFKEVGSQARVQMILGLEAGVKAAYEVLQNPDGEIETE